MPKGFEEKLSEFTEEHREEKEFSMPYMIRNKRKLQKVLNEDYLKIHNPKLTRDFLDSSKRDLAAYRSLYSKGNNYANSIYHLQQSVEKLVKSWGLKSGKISESDLKRKVSHRPGKIMIM